jgi:hypothetical protein
MERCEFPTCCTARIYHDLHRLSKATLKSNLEMDEDFLVVAITTHQQKKTNEILRECGFKRTTFKDKGGWHPENKIALWWHSPRKITKKDRRQLIRDMRIF